MRLATTITDNHVKDGTLVRSSKGKRKDDSEPRKDKSSRKKKKGDKSKAFAAVEPAKQTVITAPTPQAPGKVALNKSYTGTFPLCNHCNYHHPVGKPCRVCTKCNKFGHFAQYCRVGQNVAVPMTINTFAPPPVPVQAHMPRFGCYGCGDPNHFIRDCPHRQRNPQPALQNQPQLPAGHGRAYVLNAHPIQAIPAIQANNEDANNNT